MRNKIEGKDKYGSFALHFDNSVLSATIKGLFGDALTLKFVTETRRMVDSIAVPYWGYYSNQIECMGGTPKAELLLADSYRHSKQSGCVIDAYLAGSPLAIDQVSRLRELAGIHSDVSHHLFDSENAAKAFIDNFLASFYKSAKHNQ